MKPPKCSNCGKSEWGHVCNSVQEKVQSESKPASENVSEGIMVTSETSQMEPKAAILPDTDSSPIPHEKADTGQVARNRRWREKNREKYNAYMREYRSRK